MNQNRSVADARYKKIRALLELIAGGSPVNPGGLLRPPVDVAAGSTITMAHGGDNNFVGFDGAAITYNLPDDGVGGDVVQIKMGELGGTPSLINATGGANIEDVLNPGTLVGADGQTSLSGQGAMVTFELDTSTLSNPPAGVWRIKATGP